MEINVDTLLVLRFDEALNQVIVEREKIPQLINLEKIEWLFDNRYRQEQEAMDIIDEIRQRQTELNVLLKPFRSYCQVFHDSYTGIPALEIRDYERAEIYKIAILEKLHRQGKLGKLTDEDMRKIIIGIEDGIKEKKSKLKDELEKRVIAYNLEKMYEAMDTSIKEKKIVAYSHRRIGWSFPRYKLTDNFSIELKTNFGYGSASYFFVCLKYKGIDIIPFTQWITYSNAEYNQIISYSMQFFLQNSEWKYAMNYAAEACNLSLTNEEEFVKKYIVEECEAMVSGLEKFLVEEKLLFTKWNRQDREKIEIETSDSIIKNLVELRGYKISGALKFISKIFQFNEIIDIQKYIHRIEECNKKVQPMLLGEIDLIEGKLSDLKKKLKDVIMPAYQEYSKKENEYNKLRDAIRKEFQSKKMYNISDREVDSVFIMKYPMYEKFIVEYAEIKKRKSETETEIKSLEATKKNIKMYQRAIEDYFKTIQP